ncbi:PTS sugar transporter subunit IIA [Liquorilactobacillus mali]|uniref:PTS sugar transporter subunit IIA n=1 Tax=Liquorilactobacillus mali TaxID=1618 RepID=UPI0029532339|nr:PTS glucose transporter subunit IIA [Liquorilactobacillus mali]MDV7757530.1 PTS glucose transporter subunit IIA [Liquorilactobacillus mali]
MFSIRRKSTLKFQVVAPISGKCIPLTEVNDNVFSKKMMGDGFAIVPNPSAHQIVAPITGKIVAFPDSKHAIGIESTILRISILVHIGLNTVSLNGEGFSSEIQLNQHVNAGDSLVVFDSNMMKRANLDMTTMVIFTDGYHQPIQLGNKINQDLRAGTTVLKQA